MRQAEAEGLTLVRSESSRTGFKCVALTPKGSRSKNYTKPYKVEVRRGGKLVYLGSFATAEEAALCYAWTPEGRAESSALRRALEAAPHAPEQRRAYDAAEAVRVAGVLEGLPDTVASAVRGHLEALCCLGHAPSVKRQRARAPAAPVAADDSARVAGAPPPLLNAPQEKRKREAVGATWAQLLASLNTKRLRQVAVQQGGAEEEEGGDDDEEWPQGSDGGAADADGAGGVEVVILDAVIAMPRGAQAVAQPQGALALAQWLHRGCGIVSLDEVGAIAVRLAEYGIEGGWVDLRSLVGNVAVGQSVFGERLHAVAAALAQVGF